jgi:hypothetical protein
MRRVLGAALLAALLTAFTIGGAVAQVREPAVQAPLAQASTIAATSEAEKQAEVERDVADLAAQQGMERAAWVMAGVTGASLLVTLIGTVLLFQNLREARRVTEAALASTRASEDANRLMRRSLILENPPKIEVELFSFSTDLTVHMKARIWNSGLTTAYNIDFRAGIIIEPHPLPHYVKFPTLKPTYNFPLKELRHNQRHRVEQHVGQLHPMLNEQIARADAGEGERFYVFVRVEYLDEIDRRLWATWGYEVATNHLVPLADFTGSGEEEPHPPTGDA